MKRSDRMFCICVGTCFLFGVLTLLIDWESSIGLAALGFSYGVGAIVAAIQEANGG